MAIMGCEGAGKLIGRFNTRTGICTISCTRYTKYCAVAEGLGKWTWSKTYSVNSWLYTEEPRVIYADLAWYFLKNSTLLFHHTPDHSILIEKAHGLQLTRSGSPFSHIGFICLKRWQKGVIMAQGGFERKLSSIFQCRCQRSRLPHIYHFIHFNSGG